LAPKKVDEHISWALIKVRRRWVDLRKQSPTKTGLSGDIVVSFFAAVLIPNLYTKSPKRIVKTNLVGVHSVLQCLCRQILDIHIM